MAIDEIRALRPWYHDFSSLGIQTVFPEDMTDHASGPIGVLRRWLRVGPRGSDSLPFRVRNQRCKEPVLRALLTRAMNACVPAARVLDLFCADGYYSCWLANEFPAAQVVGVDRSGPDVLRARTAAKVLGISNVSFVEDDVFRGMETMGKFDAVLCAGGLYHLESPSVFIRSMASVVGRALVVQSVTTLESEDPDYFVTPAPGWQHGSRFTHAGLRRWLEVEGFIVVAEDRNELTGNPLAAHRGSSYFLCAPQGDLEKEPWRSGIGPSR